MELDELRKSAEAASAAAAEIRALDLTAVARLAAALSGSRAGGKSGEVGSPLPESKYGFDTEGNILVFIRGQEVVQMKGTTGRLMGEDYFSSETVLRGTGSTIEIDAPAPPQSN